MKLNECKACGNHICIIKNSVMCGYNIDRVELPIKKIEDEEDQVIEGCPKE